MKAIKHICTLCSEKETILLDSKTFLFCPECGSIYKIDRGCIYFLSSVGEGEDFLNRVKSRLKAFPAIYYFIAYLFSPLMPSFVFRINKMIKKEIKSNSLGLNIGSGPSRRSKNLVNSDIHPYTNVDVVCTAEKLPFESNTFDYVVISEVIEHLQNPKVSISEINRVLNSNGRLIASIPFMVGYHASPYDFQRYTKFGLQNLFSEFEDVQIMSFGPTGALLWIFQEWFALFLSFGNRKIHVVLVGILMLITWPIKFLDLLLWKNINSENIASTFVVTARKKTQ